MTAQEHHALYCKCGGYSQMDVDCANAMYQIKRRGGDTGAKRASDTPAVAENADSHTADDPKS